MGEGEQEEENTFLHCSSGFYEQIRNCWSLKGWLSVWVETIQECKIAFEVFKTKLFRMNLLSVKKTNTLFHNIKKNMNNMIKRKQILITDNKLKKQLTIMKWRWIFSL